MNPGRPAILTVGRFDGVHRGHQALLAEARRLAAAHNGRVVVLAFSRHPLSTLRPQSAPPPISRLEQRRKWLLEAGASEVVWLEPDAGFLAQTPEAFVAEQVHRWHPTGWVEGPDFRFGCNRSGTLENLRQLGRQHGFAVCMVPPVRELLHDGEQAVLSSTLIRRLVEAGRLAEARLALGRPYALLGTVVRGEQKGRQLGFPTINLDAGDQLLPADGVYGGWACLNDRRLLAAISVGRKPTFGGSARLLEAHLLDASGDWYDRPVELEVHHWIRDQARYESLEALTRQIRRDIDQVRFLASAANPQAPVARSEPALS